MKIKRFGTIFLAVLLVMSIILPCTVYGSESDISDIQSQQERTKEELNSANEKISSLEEAKKSLESYIEELNADFVELSESLSDLEVQAEDKEAELIATQADLSDAQKTEEKQYESMKKRIKYMYETSNTEYIELLLSAESFTEFLNRAENISKISEYDRNMLNEYILTRNTIQEKEDQIEKEKEEILEIQTATEKKKDEISLLLADAAVEIDGYAKEIASYQSEADGYEQALGEQQSILDDLMAQLKEQERKKELAEANQEANKQNTVSKPTETESKATESTTSDTSSQTQTETQKQTSSPSTDKTDENDQTNGNTDNSGGNSEDNSGGNDNGSSTSDYSDLDLMAALIECEAGGESYEGQVAVGAVVMNRVASSSFPNSITGVIYQSGQFSPVASGRLMVVLIRGANSSCYSAAQEAMGGRDNTGGALYFNNNLSNPGLIIGNHVFY